MDVMRESSVYQGILNEGREEGRVDALQKTLLRLGRKRFGEPDAATRGPRRHRPAGTAGTAQ